MKRAAGTGTVKYLGKGRHKPWVALSPSVTIEGDRIRSCVGTFATKKEAEIALVKSFYEPESDYANYTFKQVWEYYQNSRMYSKLTDSAQRYNRVAYQKCARIYSRKYSSLRQHDYQRVIDEAIENGYSGSSVKAIRSLFSLLSKVAMDLDIVTHSYSSNIVLANMKKQKAKEVFTNEEISLIRDSDEFWSIPIELMIFTGMRINEMLSIKKTDVYDNCLHGGEKTDAGRNRIIPIIPSLEPKIKILMERPGEYLVSTYNGQRMRDDTFRKEHYYPTLEKLGVRKLTPHCCRHTFFTMMSDKCNDRLAMALIGGHTDPSFSEKVYTHPDIERLRRAIETIDEPTPNPTKVTDG